MKHITAQAIMTLKVHTVSPDLSVKALAHLLLKHQIPGAPVVDPEGNLLGLVTEDDLIFRDANVHLPTVVTLFDAVFYLEDPRKLESELHKIVGKQVKDIMDPKPLTITPETDLTAMATLLHEHQQALLPVLSEGKIVGIISKTDVVRAVAREE